MRKAIVTGMVFAMSCFACSSSSTTSSNDGGGGSGLTAAQACADQAAAQCGKLKTCSATDLSIRYGDEATCTARVTQNCTNALSAPSNGNTPTHSEACAQAYSNWACADYLNDINIPAACQQQTGHVAAGGGCAFPGQCQSGFCSIAPGSSCGTCATAPAIGSSCAQVTTCGPGVVCTGDTQTCVDYAMSGGPCGTGHPCGVGLSCIGATSDGGTQGTCQANAVQTGAACDASLKMGPGCNRAQGLACNSMTKTCAAVTTATGGQPCGDVNNQSTPCGTNGVCTGASGTSPGTCTAAADDGAACDTANGPGCLLLSRCIVSAAGGTSGTCQMQSAANCH
jgi:hypothetical protein